MKIEKLNDNQIRCTLSKEDLISRQIKLSELAYGSDKAKNLFRDMMSQAYDEVGFEANDIPLVIEAIPVPNEGIVLQITKVDDPEELDTRFAKFSPFAADQHRADHEEHSDNLKSAADILDLFKKIGEEMIGAAQDNTSTTAAESSDQKVHEKSDQSSAKEPLSPDMDLTRIFRFRRMADVCRFAAVTSEFYDSPNTLYKDPVSGCFYLSLTKGKASPETYNRVCNIAIEYGETVPVPGTSLSYYDEHFKLMVKKHAVQSLAALD